jgi:3-dehydroquinate dehydratase/shikimate dehydrogenase
MPHKALAARLCDQLSPEAARAGSVNKVTLINDVVWGFSTDISGIGDAWGGLPTTGPVLILGAGGAAAAACVALEPRSIFVAARRLGAGAELGQRLDLAVAEVRWGVPVVGSVVVNCTPIGMKGGVLPNGLIETSLGVFDMAYGSGRTSAVQTAMDRGLPVVEGLDLLVAQAARSFEIWTGIPAPNQVMRKGAKRP